MANFQSERDQLAQLEWLFQQKKYDEGLARTEAALREFPASFHLKTLRYKFLRELQQNTEALQLLRQMHAMSGDNIMVVKELAELHFQQKQFPESLLYYKKLLFLDSFNSLAQERLKLLQGRLEAGVSDRLADTKAEFRVDAAPSQPVDPTVAAPAAPEIPVIETGSPQITFDAGEEFGVPDGASAPQPDGSELHFQTESAAELYFKQGMYREALAIYKNLFEKTGRTDHFLKIKAILQLLRADRDSLIIERLQRFLQLIQRRGSQIV